MDSHRLVFDSSSSHTSHMLFLGGAGSQIFRGARAVLGFEKGENNRRPFFTTAEELLLEDEYYEEQLPWKKPRLTPEQVHILERSFESENRLEPEKKSELAKKLGLQPRQIAVWFQNRRARWKTKQLERDLDRLKASYDALLADRDVLIKDNDRLSCQVISLTEKLRDKEVAAVGLQSLEQLGADGEKAAAALRTEEQLPLLMLPKGEDMLSPRSGGSAVDNGEGTALQVYSSGDSYFQETLIEGGLGCFMGAIDGGMGSEEDGGSSDDGRSYLPAGMFAEAAQEGNWWVWS